MRLVLREVTAGTAPAPASVRGDAGKGRKEDRKYLKYLQKKEENPYKDNRENIPGRINHAAFAALGLPSSPGLTGSRCTLTTDGNSLTLKCLLNLIFHF